MDMELLIVALVLLALDLVAVRRGTDSSAVRDTETRPAI
jgi:hypothetical protein